MPKPRTLLQIMVSDTGPTIVGTCQSSFGRMRPVDVGQALGTAQQKLDQVIAQLKDTTFEQAGAEGLDCFCEGFNHGMAALPDRAVSYTVDPAPHHDDQEQPRDDQD